MYGFGIALALMICIDRSCKNVATKKFDFSTKHFLQKYFYRFLSLIQKLAKNEGTGHHELKIQNINVQKILGLQYARDALEMFGYSEVRDLIFKYIFKLLFFI